MMSDDRKKEIIDAFAQAVVREIEINSLEELKNLKEIYKSILRLETAIPSHYMLRR